MDQDLLAGGDDIRVAGELFRAGEFARAREAYRRIAEREPANPQAWLRLGELALLANQTGDAERLLRRVLELSPERPEPKALLAEAFRRSGRFMCAGPLLRILGRGAVADQLESFAGVTPYAIEDAVESARVPFVTTDPLPVIEVRANNGGPVNFFIDTGAAEVILDPEFAAEIGADSFGSQEGAFAGGKRALVRQGRLDSLTLGGLTVGNLPVGLLDVRRFSAPVFGGRRVDGIIGTDLLYRFLATLDYPHGELVLRRATGEALESVVREADVRQDIVMPFWLAGDHYIVAWGQLNDSRPMLFFVDTGLAGGGFTCPESTLVEAGITVDEAAARQGIGGGGPVRAVPFAVDKLALGAAQVKGVRGVFLGSFPLENRFGFRIGGIISHRFFRSYALTLDFTGMRILLRLGD